MRQTSSKKKATGTKKEPPLHEQAKAALKKMQAKDPGLKGLIEKAYGYVVFPSVGKAAAVVGGAYGRGMVFERGKPVGYATIGQLTIGVQLGGDTFSELIVFDSREPLQRFKRGRMAFAANASAVLVKAGAAASSNFEKGAAVFVHSAGGMMLELALGGQKFKFSPTDESGTQPGSSADGKGATSGRSRGSEEGEDESGEGEEAGTSLAAAGGFLRGHPVWSILVGAGLASGAAFAAYRFLKASGHNQSDNQDEDEDDTESDEGEGDENGNQARYRRDDEEEGEEDEDEGESDEEQDDEGEEDEAEAAGEDERRGDEEDDDEEEGQRGNGRTGTRKLTNSRGW